MQLRFLAELHYCAKGNFRLHHDSWASSIESEPSANGESRISSVSMKRFGLRIGNRRSHGRRRPPRQQRQPRRKLVELRSDPGFCACNSAKLGPRDVEAFARVAARTATERRGYNVKHTRGGCKPPRSAEALLFFPGFASCSYPRRVSCRGLTHWTVTSLPHRVRPRRPWRFPAGCSPVPDEHAADMSPARGPVRSRAVRLEDSCSRSRWPQRARRRAFVPRRSPGR